MERLSHSLESTLHARVLAVKIFLCDVDGVMTDGSIYIGPSGEFKQFNILDGLGLKLLQRAGIKVGWLSNRFSEATQQRGAELKLDFLVQKSGNKLDAAREILRGLKLTEDDLAYMGDDIVDLPVMKKAALAISVPNGHADARGAAQYVTVARGGQGAVREAAELILKGQNKWSGLLDYYLEHGAS